MTEQLTPGWFTTPERIRALVLARSANSRFKIKDISLNDPDNLELRTRFERERLDLALWLSVPAKDGPQIWAAIGGLDPTLAVPHGLDELQREFLIKCYEVGRKHYLNGENKLTIERVAKRASIGNIWSEEETLGAYQKLADSLWAYVDKRVLPQEEARIRARAEVLRQSCEGLAEHGISRVRRHRGDMPQNFFEHFAMAEQSLEIIAHAFRKFGTSALEDGVRKFFDVQGERSLTISVLNPFNEPDLYGAYCSARGQPSGLRGVAIDNLDGLVQLRDSLRAGIPDIDERFSIETHDNLFGSIVRTDRSLPNERIQVEYVLGDSDDEHFGGINFERVRDDASLFAYMSRLTDKLRARSQPWPRPLAITVPEIIAHRGVHDRSNDNTLTAFKSVLQSGLQSCELDVRISADGEVVVANPPIVGGMTIANQTADELMSVNVPRLSEVLDLLGGGVGLVVELKADEHCQGTDLVPALVELLGLRRESGADDRIDVVASFDHDSALAYRDQPGSVGEVGFLWKSFDSAGLVKVGAALAAMDASDIRIGLFHYSTLLECERDVRTWADDYDFYAWVVDNAAVAAELRRFGNVRIISDRAKDFAANGYGS